MIIVDIFGLPGSGKSTLVDRLVGRSGYESARTLASRTLVQSDSCVRASVRRVVVAKTWKPSAYDVGIMLRESPQLIEDVNRLSQLGAEAANGISGMMLDMFARIHFIKRVGKKNDIVLLDEGVNQRKLSLMIRGIPTETISWPTVNLAIWLDTNVDIAKSRDRLRRTMRDDISHETAEMVRALASQNESRVIRIDGSRSRKQTQDSTLTALRPFLDDVL